jgi:hypothetical protein
MAPSTAQIEQMISELDIFAPPVIQTSVVSGDYQYFKPIQSIVGDGPISFLVPGTGDNYIDMSKTLFHVKLRIHDGAAGAAYTSEKYSVVNNLLSSLFSDVKLEFNQTVVSSSSGMYAYRAYFEQLFNYNETAKNSHCTAQLFVMDDPGEFADLDSAANLKRKEFVEKSREVELIGKLHLDVLNCGKYLLNGIDMRFTFTRNPASFVVISPESLNPKIEILDTNLLVRTVNLSASILLAHAQILNTTTAKYPFKRVEMHNFTIASGLYQKTIENMFLGRVPNRIIFGFCSNSAYSGALKENCFNFENFDVSQLTLSINGKIVNSSPLKMNYKKDSYMLPYIFSFIFTGNQLVDDGYMVDRVAYKHGYSLYAFDLTADLAANEPYSSPQQQGNVRLEITFASPLAKVCNLIIHSETQDVVEIDRNREVMLQYKK